MFRLYDTKEKKWVRSDAFVSRIGDVFVPKKSFLNKFGFLKLQLLSERRYVSHSDIRVKDRIGNSIYEGDICWCDIDGGVHCVVAYSSDNGSYLLFNNRDLLYYPIVKEVVDKIEVRGNVFDNPELVPETSEKEQAEDVENTEEADE